MTANLPALTLMSILPACLLGIVAVGASLRAPSSELAYVLGLGVSVLGGLLACFWFWNSGIYLYSLYSVAALLPVVTGTFALARAVV